MYNKMETSLWKIPNTTHIIQSLYMVGMKIKAAYRYYLITERTHKEHWYLSPWKHFVMRHNVTLLWKMNIKGIH